MPSNLTTNRTQLQRARKQLGQQQSARQALPTNGPWGGYVPNLEAALRTPAAALNVVGLISRGEELGPDLGWMRHQDHDNPVTAALPLGAAGAGFPAVTGRPVVLTEFFVRNPSQDEQNIAMTAQQGITGALYRFDLNGAANWEEITFSPAGVAAIVAPHTKVPDATVYSPADRLIVTNNSDDIYMYPETPGGPGSARYIELPTPTSAPNLTNLKARSCTTFAERLVLLNVSRNAVRYPREMRWTELGWSTPAASNWQNVGSGALEWREFTGEGVAIRPITRQRAVAYFTDGVGFVDSTGYPTAPFQTNPVTRERGLFGTRAVVDLGNGTHFGVFTDGWFLFSANGAFQEAGLVELGGVTHRKWADDFYGRLHSQHRHRVVVGYDPRTKLIYISWPNANSTGDPNEVWKYDWLGDRVWPDDYVSGFTANKSPLCFARYRQVSIPATTYDDLGSAGTDYDGLTGTTYDELGATLGQKRFVHGTVDGFVYQHDPSTVLRDGVRPSWLYRTHPNHFGDPARWKTYQRVYVEYRQSAAPQTVFGDLYDGANRSTPVATESFVPDDGQVDGVFTDYLDFHRSVLHAGLVLRGSHPTTIKSFREEILPSGGDVVEEP